MVSPEAGPTPGWDESDWGEEVEVDLALEDARAEDYDALVLSGGQINPDLLRVNDRALDFIRAMFDASKPIAAICHAPWLLIETGIIAGRRATSYNSIKTDMKNAGADWIDENLVVHQGLGTSRNPGDLEPFCARMVEEFAGGRHERRQAM